MSDALHRAASFGHAVSFESLTVSSTAVGLTVPSNVHSAFVSTDGETVRFRMDGSNPTSTVGHKLPLDTFIEFYRDDLAHVRFIATGSDATLFVTYYRN
jgi:hypothetical protein